MKGSIFRWAAIVMAILSFGIAAFFAGKIYYTEKEYAERNAAYEEVVEQAVISVPEVPGESPEPDGEAVSQEVLETQSEEGPIVPEIDFAALKEINEEVVGWLYLPDTVINYPVVQGDDNSYYLRHLVDGNYNSNGCLFMDYKNQSDFTDDNTLVYGHHMNSGKMFASLVEYKEQSFYDAHPVLYFLTEDAVYQIELFAGYTTTADTGAYMISLSTREEKIEWLKEMFHSSDFFADVTVSALDHIVTFSTCAYDFQDARYVVHGKLTLLEEGV
ncbi:MAG: class B sortase [Lachnospiraceae bacterium]|nr:class B sortase [Lachnospiraceae bacterium]